MKVRNRCDVLREFSLVMLLYVWVYREEDGGHTSVFSRFCS